MEHNNIVHNIEKNIPHLYNRIKQKKTEYKK
jgi:hypothetical protein